MKMKPIVLLAVQIFSVFLYSSASGIDIYVDQTLSYDILNGLYSVKNRNNRGDNGNAYRTIQAAINAVNSGDTIHMRGGTYYEHISIPDGKQGSSERPITLRSFPGEWAIIDGQSGNHAVIRYLDGPQSVCPLYWIFRNFEVTGGGVGNEKFGSGGGIMLDTAAHITFKYLYIHDNGGGGGWNDAGIAIKNEDQGAQHITIKYCYFRDNSCVDNPNCANISLFSDYVGTPSDVNIKNARHSNEIAYNYIVGSNKGIKSKGEQYLSLSNTGTHIICNRLGDRIHHNIVEDFYGDGIECRQDFIQVHNNIVLSAKKSSDSAGIVLGCQDWNTDREPFHAVAYNNLLIGVDLGIEHQENGVYSPPLHPHCYFYNNILENVGPEHYDGRNDLNIFFTYNLYNKVDIDMSTVHVECNLFTPRGATDEIINLADDQDHDMSASQWLASGYSTKLYTTHSTSGLHKAGSIYRCNGSYVVGGSATIANGGIGGKHPYLKAIRIPSYIGAANPDDDQWVEGVLSLSNIENLMNYASMDPQWIERGADSLFQKGGN